MDQLQFFKTGIPEWGIRTCIFMLLIPNLLLFSVSTANIGAACGFYGIDPNDAQFSLLILYAALVGFFPMERHFSGFFSIRNYLVISLIMEIVTAYAAYLVRDFTLLLVIRFLQGIANICLVAICISLIFNRLKTERSREIGYSVVYCILLCIAPLTIIVTAPLIDQTDYNQLYLCTVYAFLPGGIFAFLILNAKRVNPKIPLYQLDWKSFVIYTTALVSLAYTLNYGQQLNWFSNTKIVLSFSLFLGCAAIHVVRQKHSKRPYLNMKIFSYRTYRIGIVMILVLYIARGAFNFTYSFFSQTLGFSPEHLGLMLIWNIIGAVSGTIISSRLMIFKTPPRLIWISGLTLLLAHHLWMIFLFNTQGNESCFILPLVIQGMGAGMLLTPIIVYMVTSVPSELGPTAVATAVSMRLLGTLLSIAAINYFQLYGSGIHGEQFQLRLSSTDPAVLQRLAQYQQSVSKTSGTGGTAEHIANLLLKNAVEHQSALLTAIDYYVIICGLLIFFILLIAIIPSIHYKKVQLDSYLDIPV